MIELQNRWYNGLVEQLGLDPGTFQISQPSPPMTESDSALWEYQDAIPPASLTFNRYFHKVPRFSGQYLLVMRQIQLGEDTLEKSIGTETHRKWFQFLEQQRPPPRLDQLPAVFLNWAMLHSPATAVTGASALARVVLTAANPPQPSSP